MEYVVPNSQNQISDQNNFLYPSKTQAETPQICQAY